MYATKLILFIETNDVRYFVTRRFKFPDYLIPQFLAELVLSKRKTLLRSMGFPTAFGAGGEKMMIYIRGILLFDEMRFRF